MSVKVLHFLSLLHLRVPNVNVVLWSRRSISSMLLGVFCTPRCLPGPREGDENHDCAIYPAPNHANKEERKQEHRQTHPEVAHKPRGVVRDARRDHEPHTGKNEVYKPANYQDNRMHTRRWDEHHPRVVCVGTLHLGWVLGSRGAGSPIRVLALELSVLVRTLPTSILYFCRFTVFLALEA